MFVIIYTYMISDGVERLGARFMLNYKILGVAALSLIFLGYGNTLIIGIVTFN